MAAAAVDRPVVAVAVAPETLAVTLAVVVVVVALHLRLLVQLARLVVGSVLPSLRVVTSSTPTRAATKSVTKSTKDMWGHEEKTEKVDRRPRELYLSDARVLRDQRAETRMFAIAYVLTWRAR
jgi:hypothetical protein